MCEGLELVWKFICACPKNYSAFKEIVLMLWSSV